VSLLYCVYSVFCFCISFILLLRGPIFLTKIRGDIILKAWEANIAESKKMAKEINEGCEESFDLLDKKSLG
jgi:hypothetical protein